ncbi:MAG: flagellar brake protein, partial [Candidatus Obscuribacterales bacterium]|nr:flagellar brake protein [Steroidobacteraceae bacterium]
MKDPRRVALETLIRDYGDIGARSRLGLLVSPGDSKANYKVDVVGVIRQKRFLVLTAPATDDGSLIAVSKGQTLVCRWFSATTAFQFRATIVRILFEPIPLLHVELPEVIERQTVRGEPRALATLRALINAPLAAESVLVDISISGARIAVNEDVPLKKSQAIELLARPHLLHRDYELTLHCRVTGNTANND